MNTDLAHFATRLCNSISAGFQVRHFDALALELFALQFKYNATYRAICQAGGRRPDVIEHWSQIPAAPAYAFKEFELSSIPPGQRISVFHSSGTTGQRASRHFHSVESLAVYETSLWNWFQVHFSQAVKLVLLTPNPQAAPHSSLVHMFETIRQKSRPAETAFTGILSADGSWTLDFNAIVQELTAACDTAKPLTLLGTAFSFIHLLDFLDENNLRFKLPKDSSVMETGGYKNRSRSMAKNELHALINERLGIAPEKIIGEYGMSELCSQAYAMAAGTFHFPPWAHTQIISAETGREVDDGETGLIRVFDLANVFSVATIQTEDLAVRRGDGFELIGRAPMSEPRGCSLMTP